MDDVKEFVSNLNAEEQEAILTEMMDQNRIAIHVESLNTTYGVSDVYDNSSQGNPNSFNPEGCVLTILFVEGK